MLHAVIMAGGSGTRFWPASREACPKQLLALSSDQSMLRETVDRLESLTSPKHILVITSEKLVDAVRRDLPELPKEAIIGEPCKRNTAPCIGLAALHLARQSGDATMLVMPADHVISQKREFERAVRYAQMLIDEDPTRIVTFGIRPTYAATGYGYIERREPLHMDRKNALDDLPSSYRVKQFHEKPDHHVARQYIESGNYLWNSGIFLWKASTILDELATHEPNMLERLEKIVISAGDPSFVDVFRREFRAIESKSIDYAVLERATNVVVIEAPFDWDDVGSWQSLARLRGTDAQGNTIVGKHVGRQTSDTIVRGSDDHLIVTMGLKNCLVVHTPDATLVASKDDDDAMREIIRLIDEQGLSEYL